MYETLLNRLREALSTQLNVEEKKMFNSLCFMVDDKMCVCVQQDGGLLCRIGREEAAIELQKDHCRPMMQGSRVMKDFVYVDAQYLQTPAQLNYWLEHCLRFNKTTKPSKKKQREFNT